MKPGERPAAFGPRLKRLREDRGVSLREIAETTKVSVRTLESLESDDPSRLPGGIFSRAIVRGYASAIGADPESTVKEFAICFPEPASGATGHEATTNRRTSHRWIVVLAAILVPLAAMLAWSLLA